MSQQVGRDDEAEQRAAERARSAQEHFEYAVAHERDAIKLHEKAATRQDDHAAALEHTAQVRPDPGRQVAQPGAESARARADAARNRAERARQRLREEGVEPQS